MRQQRLATKPRHRADSEVYDQECRVLEETLREEPAYETNQEILLSLDPDPASVVPCAMRPATWSCLQLLPGQYRASYACVGHLQLPANRSHHISQHTPEAEPRLAKLAASVTWANKQGKRKVRHLRASLRTVTVRFILVGCEHRGPRTMRN